MAQHSNTCHVVGLNTFYDTHHFLVVEMYCHDPSLVKATIITKISLTHYVHILSHL